MRFILMVMSVCLSAMSFAESPVPDLLGEVTPAEILGVPEFQKEYEAATPAEDDNALNQALAEMELVVLFGSWCHDSQREVPRLLKLLSSTKVSVTYIAVSRDKQEPMVAVGKHQLQFTPTLVAYQAGEEVARIVETPEGSWEQQLRSLAKTTLSGDK